MITKRNIVFVFVTYLTMLIAGLAIDAMLAEDFNRNEWLSNIFHVLVLLFMHLAYTVIMHMVADDTPMFSVQNIFENVHGDAQVGDSSRQNGDRVSGNINNQGGQQ